MYYQYLKFLYSKSNKLLTENSDRVNNTFERADKIIIWLVGFSIGVFVLLLSSDLDKANPNFKLITSLSINIIIISLIVVILGLLFRLCSFFAQNYLNSALMNFSGFTESQVNFPDLPEVHEIKETDSIDDILFYLDLDYGYKRDKPINLPPDKMKEYRGLLKTFYEELARTNDQEKQLEIFWKTYAEYFGLTKKETAKYIKGKTNHRRNGKLHRIFYVLASALFLLTIGTFIFGVSLILITICININCS